MKFDSDDFELFDLPRRFEQDRDELDARWRDLQRQVHPDRFAADGAAAQRAAMQWAVRVNEAHQRLRDPLQRAAYLCELAGSPINAESNTAMPADFLTQQMTWREALDDAADQPSVAALADRVAAFRRDAFDELARTLDQRADAASAVQQVRALMFVERFADDVERRLEAFEQEEEN